MSVNSPGKLFLPGLFLLAPGGFSPAVVYLSWLTNSKVPMGQKVPLGLP
jgi:hypothetical protein